MTIRRARKIQRGEMDSRPERAEKTRPVDPSLVSCLTGYSAMRTRQAERRWITIGREDASDGFRCSGSLSHWHCPCCCLVLPLPPPNGQRDKSLRSSPLERERAGNEQTSIKPYEEALHVFYRFAPSPASPWISSWLGRATRQPPRRCATLEAFQVALEPFTVTNATPF
jgi:hypothetical protein